ncbi:UPF0175 family protein [Niallia sp. HCP3S3_B10]|uniref:UPF0175 family protein n=1 Tax=unclassified Niallia TaxID=2837522 RepID=UPI0037C92E27
MTSLVFVYCEKITLARAAELGGKSISDFIQILINHNIHWAEYTEEHKKQDDETIDFILKEDGKGKQDESDL